jgi:NAD(P)-dependent dehydrogenase (short-subunit alcohol dehydrogenase family)
MGKLDGQVAFITGAARGQGRAHAVRLAQEGADIIAIDICQQMHAVTYPMSTRDDLDETVRQVEALGQRIEAYEADVRDLETLQKSFDHGSAQLGPVSIVVANAGIGPGGVASAEQQWDEVIGVNLTGVWNTGRVAIPSMILQHVPALANSLTNAIPVEAVDAEDVANTVAWLASDDARYIAGTVIPVDAGNVNRR